MDEKPVFLDLSSLNVAPTGGDVMAIIYWPCNHRWPKRWWHRLRGEGTHRIVTDSWTAVSGNELTVEWDAQGRMKVR